MQVLPGNRAAVCREQQDQSPAPRTSALPFAVSDGDPRSRQHYHSLPWLRYHLLLLLLAWDHQPHMFATKESDSLSFLIFYPPWCTRLPCGDSPAPALCCVVEMSLHRTPHFLSLSLSSWQTLAHLVCARLLHVQQGAERFFGPGPNVLMRFLGGQGALTRGRGQKTRKAGSTAYRAHSTE